MSYVTYLFCENKNKNSLSNSALYDTGIRQLEKSLLESKIKYVKIAGNESAVKKEQSKLYVQ